MDFGAGSPTCVFAQRIGLPLCCKDSWASRLALSQETEMGRIGYDAVFRPWHLFRQGLRMNGRGNTLFVAKVQNQHRNVNPRKAVRRQRLNDAGVDDDREADARIAEVLGGGL